MIVFHRDDPEFEGIRERAMQRIVSGEVDKSTGRLIDWSKALALEMEMPKKSQVTSTCFSRASTVLLLD